MERANLLPTVTLKTISLLEKKTKKCYNEEKGCVEMMMSQSKKLSIAFYWHMHQPVYEIEGTYLMPWARLHAVKDYLDMILVLEKFPN